MGNIFEKILKKRQEERAPDAENAGAREPGSYAEYRAMRFAGELMAADERFVPKDARIVAYEPQRYAADLAGSYIALRKKDPGGWGELDEDTAGKLWLAAMQILLQTAFKVRLAEEAAKAGPYPGGNEE